MEYEGLHSICFFCGEYGHKSETCPKQTPSTSAEQTTENPTAVTSVTPTSDEQHHPVQIPNMSKDQPFGPWMQPKRVARRRENGGTNFRNGKHSDPPSQATSFPKTKFPSEHPRLVAEKSQ